VYERGGSLKVILEPGAGASSRCGTTARGCSNVLKAFRSEPVSVSQVRTRVGVTSDHSSTSSRSALKMAMGVASASMMALRCE